jgi:hypothetical protein
VGGVTGTGDTQDEEGTPDVGSLVLDAKRDRVGVVMDRQGGRVYLRPPQGGREWEAAPEDVRPAKARDELRARVAEINAAGRWGR